MADENVRRALNTKTLNAKLGLRTLPKIAIVILLVRAVRKNARSVGCFILDVTANSKDSQLSDLISDARFPDAPISRCPDFPMPRCLDDLTPSPNPLK
jgi:hypothetical protein